MIFDFLYPNKKKLLIAFIGTILWYSFKRMSSLCLYGCIRESSIYRRFLLFGESCFCRAPELADVLKQYLKIIILPFLILYIVLSLTDFIKRRTNKNNLPKD